MKQSLEDYVLDKAVRDLRALRDVRPDQAHERADDVLVHVLSLVGGEKAAAVAAEYTKLKRTAPWWAYA